MTEVRGNKMAGKITFLVFVWILAAILNSCTPCKCVQCPQIKHDAVYPAGDWFDEIEIICENGICCLSGHCFPEEELFYGRHGRDKKWYNRDWGGPQ